MGRVTKRFVGICYTLPGLIHCTNIYQAPTTERQVRVDESLAVLRLRLPTHKLRGCSLTHPRPHPMCFPFPTVSLDLLEQMACSWS